MKILNNEIHIWIAYDEEIQDEHLLKTYEKMLSAEEFTRYQRFNFEKRQQQFLISHALLRSVLSKYVESISPDQWMFNRNEHGKPFIANTNLPMNLHFNLSHTQGMVVLAVTPTNCLGIDVENSLRTARILDIAYRYFDSYECQLLQTKSFKQQPSWFYSLWTLKEAYVKARGMALTRSLNKAIFSIDNNYISASFDEELSDDPNDWNFWLLRPDEAYIIAVAKQRLLPSEKFSLSIHEITPAVSMKDISATISVITSLG